MAAAKAKRGRPKGTGKDDRIWLREIARLMRIDPLTPPTAAIRALGIDDPSTIRRLRDKHKQQTSAHPDCGRQAIRGRGQAADQVSSRDATSQHRPSAERGADHVGDRNTGHAS